MGSIPDVNLVEGMEIPEEKSIGEMLRELESEIVEQINETIPDNGNFSMTRENQGKPSKVPSPVTKAEAKKKGKAKEQLKPPPKSRLGPTVGAASKPAPTQATTGPSPKKGVPLQSPEGAPLLTNPRINPLTGMPYTTEAEKRAIREIMETRKRPLEKEDEEEEEVTTKNKSPQGRPQKILWLRRRLWGKPPRKSWKGLAKSSRGKKVPSKADSGQKHT